MRGFLYGLAAGIACGAAAQMLASRNHDKLLELAKNLPTSLTLGPNATLDELKVHRARLEDLIKEKLDEYKELKG